MTIRSKPRKNTADYIPFLLLLAALPLFLAACGNSSGGASSANTVTVNNYAYPTDITRSNDGTKLFVANNVLGSISVYDADSLSQIAEIKVGCGPRHIVVNDDDTRLIVGHDNNSNCKTSPLYVDDGGDGVGYTYLSYIDLTTYTLLKEIKLQSMSVPGSFSAQSMESVRGMFWDTTNDRLYVTSLVKSDLAVLDTDLIESATATQVTFATNTYGEIPWYYKTNLKAPIALAVNDARTYAYLPQSETSANGLSILDLTAKAHTAGSPRSLQYYYATKNSDGTLSRNIGTCYDPSYIQLTSGGGEAIISCYDKSSRAENDVIIVTDVSDPAAAATAALTLGYVPVIGCVKPSVIHLTDDEEHLLALCAGSGMLITLEWDNFKSAIATNVAQTYVHGLAFKVGSQPSDMTVIGDYAYVTDLMENKIYKINYKISFNAYAILSYAIDPFKEAF
jgi:YVTN family beta-propeller protein